MNGKKMASLIIALAILVAAGCALSIYLFFKYYEPKPVQVNTSVDTTYHISSTPSHLL